MGKPKVQVFRRMKFTSAALLLLPAVWAQRPSLTTYNCTDGTLSNLTTVSSLGTNAGQVYNLTGDWQEISWQSPIVNTTGETNTENSTRAIEAAGEVLVERLVYFSEEGEDDNRTYAQYFEFANGPIAFAALGNVTLYSYLERLESYSVTPSQSLVVWDVVICSSDPATAAGVFQQVH